MKRGHATDIHALLQGGRTEPLFLRITGHSAEVERIILQLFDAARLNGVVIDGRIPNPTDSNLSYYNETMGQDFQMDQGFILRGLTKWMPRMNPAQQQLIAQSLYETLRQMERSGKTLGMLKNAYTRFMCWLYFKFERVAIKLGEGKFPLVLYQGEMSAFELSFLSILCTAGCDVAYVQTTPEAAYQKIDPRGEYSDAVQIPGTTAFPPNFSINALYKESFNRQARQPQPAPARPATPPVRTATPPVRPSAPPPARPAPAPVPAQRPPVDRPLQIPPAEYTIYPNAWMPHDTYDSMLLPSVKRGEDAKTIYTCFVRREGAEDRLTYQNELIQLHQRLLEAGRKPMIVDGGFAQPTPEEIQKVNRRSYRSVNEAIVDLSSNLRNGVAVDLQSIAIHAFMEILAEEGKKPDTNPNRISNNAVYLLCWFRRCYQALFEGWKPKKLGCLIYMGAVQNEREALFLRFLSKLPTDILILSPNLDDTCCVQDPLLFVQSFNESVNLKHFPQESSRMVVGTAAAHAESDLTGTLYNGTGLYRSMQFDQAQALVLRSTYEEIALYWDQELKYRPNFSTVNETVMMPVIFAQANGVKAKNVGQYWVSIKQLITEDTIVIKQFPFFNKAETSPAAGSAVDFYRNGKLQREKIKGHRSYPFAFLKEGTQEHILNKLQLLIDQKLIRGTGENGTEFQIISVVLSMKKEWLRMIQKFDFTKKNPKIICISTNESMASKEDAIMLAFLSLIGFDVVCFAPTGYQCLGQWFSQEIAVGHEVGEYMYDLTIPDFNLVTQNTHSVWNIFRRGS